MRRKPKTYTRGDIIAIAKKAKRDPGSVTLDELRALALFVQTEPDDEN